MIKLVYPFVFLIILSFQCNKEVQALVIEQIKNKENENGIRIAWDYQSLQRLAPLSDRQLKYFGYPRMIELHNHTLLCVYETSEGNSELIRSSDEGKSWSIPLIIFTMTGEITQAVPEIVELDDRSVLVACNSRPRNAPASGTGDITRRFGIKVKKSTDGGLSFGDEKVVCQAGSAFGNGCWEPSFVQLPSGEVQLFYSDEGVYLSSDEQNISIFRSTDKGGTWTSTPEIVSFRAGRRDGMPVPLVLKGTQEIVLSIEDNGFGEFKPSIIRSSLADNWKKGYVSADNDKRESALLNPLSATVYAGAPYMRQLPGGEVVLSYQGNEGRSVAWNHSCMFVCVGTAGARNFNRTTIPFNVPDQKSGLWNSLSVLTDNTVVALTSTNAYSETSTEVWMIKGFLIPELKPRKATITIDGNFADAAWNNKWPIFIGHMGKTHLTSNLAWDENYLYFSCKVNDAKIFRDSGDPEKDDAVKISLDVVNSGFSLPYTGTYSFLLSSDNQLKAQKGFNGKWLNWAPTILPISQSTRNSEGYQQEIAIPWSILKVHASKGMTFRLNMGLIEDFFGGDPLYTEQISSNRSDQPYTWCQVQLE